MRHLNIAAVLVLASSGCLSSELGHVASVRGLKIDAPVAKVAFDASLRAACGEGGINELGERALERWPYLQQTTSSSVEIVWTAGRDRAPATVRLTTPAGAELARLEARLDPGSNRKAFAQYFVSAAGLEPETIYCYELVGSAPWSGRIGFRTAPTADSTTPIRFAVIGDLGRQTSDQRAVLAELKRVPFDFLIVVGDLAYDRGTLSEHQRNFFDVYRDVLMHVPAFVIAGNHDYHRDGAVFREVFRLPANGGDEGRERWYSFDWGSAHFVGIDTEILSETQAKWLGADLAASKSRWKVAFLHKPPYSSGLRGSDSAVRRLYASQFSAHRVQLSLSGHDHNYERTRPIRGVTYVVTGGGGRGTRAVGSSAFSAYAEAVAHFTFVEITPKKMKVNAVDATGADFDTVIIPP